MKLGLFGMSNGVCAGPDAAVEVARHAEAAGFESLWVGEHVVVPSPRVPPSPMEPTDPGLDPLVSLTWLAAATSTIRLATGIVILPQRNPLVLAKQVASLDVLSKGRLDLGIGAGYLEPEFRAIGAPFEDRGRATDEFLGALRSLWADAAPAYAGTHVAFSGVDAYPRPVQAAGPTGGAGVPVHVGGHSRAAYRRALTSAQGWYGFGLDHARTEACLAELAAVAEQVERPSWLGPLEITVSPGLRLDADAISRFAELGVHRLAALVPTASVDGLKRAIDHIAAAA